MKKLFVAILAFVLCVSALSVAQTKAAPQIVDYTMVSVYIYDGYAELHSHEFGGNVENEISKPVAEKPKTPRKRAAAKPKVLVTGNPEQVEKVAIALTDRADVVGADETLPPPKSAEKADYRFCHHENLKKDKYGKTEVVFQPGKGAITHCADCGIKITSFHTSVQPGNRPTKVHLSKKDRRLGKKIQQELAKTKASEK